MGTGAVSRYKVDARQLLSTVTDVSKGRGGNPGLSPSQLLSNEQRINAKTVTSLLILLSVLACVVYYFLIANTSTDFGSILIIFSFCLRRFTISRLILGSFFFRKLQFDNVTSEVN